MLACQLPSMEKSITFAVTPKKMLPTYSICNLLGSDRCMAELVVASLREFLDTHQDIRFPHRHDFFQIVLFTRNGGHHSIDFRSYEAVRGQVYCMAPGQIHTWEFDDQTDGFLVNFNETFFTSICHDPNFIVDFPLFDQLNENSVNALEGTVFNETERIFIQMLDEFNHFHDHRIDMLRGLLLTLIIQLSRSLPVSDAEVKQKNNTDLIRQFDRLISQHFREKRLPREYAELMFITPNHLNAVTNNLLGKSAGELIRNRILLEAKRMLVNSDLQVSQIAEFLNFEDYAYFTRFFKKYTGITPEGFRQANMRHDAGIVKSVQG